MAISVSAHEISRHAAKHGKKPKLAMHAHTMHIRKLHDGTFHSTTHYGPMGAAPTGHDSQINQEVGGRGNALAENLKEKIPYKYHYGASDKSINQELPADTLKEASHSSIHHLKRHIEATFGQAIDTQEKAEGAAGGRDTGEKYGGHEE